jgi:hypothetical protein
MKLNPNFIKPFVHCNTSYLQKQTLTKTFQPHNPHTYNYNSWEYIIIQHKVIFDNLLDMDIMLISLKKKMHITMHTYSMPYDFMDNLPLCMFKLDYFTYLTNIKTYYILMLSNF